MKEFPAETSTIELKYQTEWEQSAIDQDIIDANFRAIDGGESFSFLVRSPDRRNDGRLTDRHLRTYDRLQAGGWICTGIDPLAMERSEWGCLKPLEPRMDEAKGKVIKYEHPYGVPTEVFCLAITYRIGLKIAIANNLEAEYLERMGINQGEDKGFWQWVKDNPSIVISLTEGAKKAADFLVK